MGIDDAEFAALMKRFDTDGSGTVSIAEFTAAAVQAGAGWFQAVNNRGCHARADSTSRRALGATDDRWRGRARRTRRAGLRSSGRAARPCRAADSDGPPPVVWALPRATSSIARETGVLNLSLTHSSAAAISPDSVRRRLRRRDFSRWRRAQRRVRRRLCAVRQEAGRRRVRRRGRALLRRALSARDQPGGRLWGAASPAYTERERERERFFFLFRNTVWESGPFSDDEPPRRPGCGRRAQADPASARPPPRPASPFGAPQKETSRAREHDAFKTLWGARDERRAPSLARIYAFSLFLSLTRARIERHFEAVADRRCVERGVSPPLTLAAKRVTRAASVFRRSRERRSAALLSRQHVPSLVSRSRSLALALSLSLALARSRSLSLSRERHARALASWPRRDFAQSG